MEINNLKIPYGFCHCGCGQKTKIAIKSDKGRNHVKGEPIKFIIGHAQKGRVRLNKQQFCKNGHERTPENINKNGNCKLCIPVYKKEYYAINSEKIINKTKKWQTDNPEKVNEKNKEWAKNNPEKVKKKQSRYDVARRARELNAFVSHVVPYKIFKRDWFTCMICKKPLDMNAKTPHPLSPSIDHIIPLSKGGTHEPSNVQAAHLICNISKGNKLNFKLPAHISKRMKNAMPVDEINIDLTGYK